MVVVPLLGVQDGLAVEQEDDLVLMFRFYGEGLAGLAVAQEKSRFGVAEGHARWRARVIHNDYSLFV